MKKLLLICIALALTESLSAQRFALKNNLVYDAFLTPNLSLEIGLSPRMTLDLGGGYNWFEFSDNERFKHWLVQPELRLWTCERFNGSFWGLHLHGGEYSLGWVDMPFGLYPGLKNSLAEGWFAGAGISFGHQWILGKRWNLEASIGAGYAYTEYDKYTCNSCEEVVESGTKNYFGVTRATLSLVYFLW